MIEDEKFTYQHFQSHTPTFVSNAEQYKAKMKQERPFKTASEMYQLLTDLMKA